MKSKILFLSSMICMCSMAAAVASECTGDDCYEPEQVYESIESETSWFDYDAPNTPVVEYETVTDEVVVDTPSNLTPMRNVKLLSIKPAPIDDRPPVWDGTTGKYTPRAYPKTVSWKNGVPLWDDSISNYKKKDFRDWFLEPLPELYIRNADDTELVALYNDTMNDAVTTRARIEELLSPNRPNGNLWLDNPDDTEKTEHAQTIIAAVSGQTNAAIVGPMNSTTASTQCNTVPIVESTPCVATEPNITASAPATATPCDTTPTQQPVNPQYTAQDLSAPIYAAFGTTNIWPDGCPFETETECNIWRRKPIIRENVSPRSPMIRPSSMMEILSTVQATGNIDATSPSAAPLVDRYRMLMRSAAACCTEGMVYSLRNAGASDGLIYKFMSDDANFYNIGERCLMMTDNELAEKYPETATASVIADVRNGCLCRGRQWFTAMLAPFVDAWNASPEFAASKFYWTYTDGLQRKITVSINDDVQNVLDQLAVCP